MKNKIFKFFVLSLVLVLIVGCSNKNEKSSGKEESNNNNNDPVVTHTVEMDTTEGKITIDLFGEVAPKTVENFVTHAENGYYDNVAFHRVINGFMIQGGDPEGNGTGGESIWGEPFADEFSTELRHYRGAISMANSGADTNGSQFFIVQNNKVNATEAELKEEGYSEAEIARYLENGGTPYLDNKHTIFGYVTSGLDVVDKIAKTETENDKPVEKILIKSIKVTKL